MAKDSKFGTFGGVYTPSLLTILGVIMYLRLPWVVGNAGLQLSLGIIAVAHVISVCTGLSISSIATDKNVGAGGPYYIVSRSLGLPIGGTLGLALFVGLSFSISLYVIGFCESVLSYFNVEASVDNIRMAGSATLVLLTVVTLISTAFAIKAQYVIFALIALSLGSVLFGPSARLEEPVMAVAEGAPTVGELFGIFFPAVTGFTAGVNMSGDLRNAKQSIPRGTMAAIATGLVVYVGLSVYVATYVPREQLINNKSVLVDIAGVDWLVVGGIWGATLSSALGSILGAPRILQALSSDRVTPTWFAKGYGKTNEPRNALLLAFLIGWSGILIAELDVIAAIVSMVFLTTYAVLNVSCALESWASPDFRPDFKIPKTVSVLGAVTCFVVMIQLDIGAMAGAMLLMAGLYAWLKRKQLRLDSGDAWAGFWASLVRSGLYRLSQERHQARNWRPNVLAFRSSREGSSALVAFGESLVGGNGLLTDFCLRPPGFRPVNEPTAERRPAAKVVGVFRRDLPAEDTFKAIEDACRYHGFAGLQPNTVLLDWREYRGHPERLSRVVDVLTELDYNQLVFCPAQSDEPKAARVDVWWKDGAGNLSFSLALIRFITTASAFRDAKIRFLFVSDDGATNDILRSRARRVIKEARVSAEIVVVNNGRQPLPIAEWAQRQSSDAALTVVGLDGSAEHQARSIGQFEDVLDEFGAVLLMRGSSGFEDVLTVARKVSHSLVPAAPQQTQPISTDLAAGDNAQVQARVRDLAERYETSVLALHEHAIARLYAPQVELLRALRAATERRANALRERLAGENPRRQRKLINRVHNNFLQEVHKLLSNFLERELPGQRDALEGRVEAFVTDEQLWPREPDQLIWIHEQPERFKASVDDPIPLRRFKRRRRIVAALKRSRPSYPVPTGVLESFAADALLRRVLVDAVQRVTSDCHQLAVHIGKRMNEPDLVLSLLRGVDEGQDVGEMIEAHRVRTLEYFDELIADEKKRAERSRRRLVEQTRGVLQEYASHMQRLDIRRDRKRFRIRDKDRRALEAELVDMAGPWHDNQKALVDRALLGLELSAVHHRITAIVSREREELGTAFRSGVMRDIDALLKALRAFEAELETGKATPDLARAMGFEHKPDFDPSPIVERLVRETEHAVFELPESVSTLDNESIERLEERGSRVTEVERVDLPVRTLVQFAVESELLGILTERLQRLPQVEQRASAVGHDVARLLDFHVTEYESEDHKGSEEFAQHMLPAVENGIERLDAERAKLTTAVDEVLAILDERLDAVLLKTGVYELAGSSDKLDVNLRRERGRRAVTGARGALHRVVAAARRASVMGLYRLSAGLLLAKRLRQGAASHRHVVERVIADTAAHTPNPDALDKLPYYYRQLFLGNATLNENFWVHRDHEVELAKKAIDNFKRGVAGCLVIEGDRGSGKSALWQHVTSRYLERSTVVRVHPVAGGTKEVRAFERALSDSMGKPGTPVELIRSLEQGAVVILDDFELWWERSPGGFGVVDVVLDLIDRFSDRCLFVLCMSRPAYRFIRRLRPIDDRALSVIECSMVSAETLKQIISLRHESTGVSYLLGETRQEELSQWAVARLFAAHFHYSRGLVGPALQAWISHITDAGKETIDIRRPVNVSVASFGELPLAQTSVLVQLALHKQLSEQRLLRLVPGPRRATLQLVASLTRVGLIVEPRARVYEINRFVHHLLMEVLKQRGLLS